jgi:hypothetical protein
MRLVAKRKLLQRGVPSRQTLMDQTHLALTDDREKNPAP